MLWPETGHIATMPMARHGSAALVRVHRQDGCRSVLGLCAPLQTLWDFAPADDGPRDPGRPGFFSFRLSGPSSDASGPGHNLPQAGFHGMDAGMPNRASNVSLTP